jgi:polysaccharide export outer membrane protein
MTRNGRLDERNNGLEPARTVMKSATALVSRSAIGFAMVLVLGVAAQAAPQNAIAGREAALAAASANGDSPQPVPRYPRYQLHKSDVVELDFTFSPEFNQAVTVQPDGFIALKEAGEIQAEGLTLPQLLEQVKNAYGKILSAPVVTAVLKDFEKPSFVVGGQVGRPGKYELRADTTVTEAIAIAGGFNSSAKHSQVVLFRRVSRDLYEAKLINVKKMLKSRDLSEDSHLKPGDTLFVPQNSLSKIRPFVPNPGIGLGATF